jgi:maltose O-acetyltransferase
MIGSVPDSQPATPNGADTPPAGLFAKVRRIVREEFGAVHPRLLLAMALTAPLPPFAGGRLRVQALRAAGFRIGQGSLMFGMPTFTGRGAISQRLTIGAHSLFNVGCVFDLADTVTIGEGVSIGHQVMFLTASHQIGPKRRRAGDITTAPITIGDGCWIAARCVILPGITVGAGSVIGAGMIVNRDVPPDTMMSGTQRVSLARWR